jgi:hypothetical protein
MHKDKPNITSKEATREIMNAGSFPSVMRNGNAGGIGDVASPPSSTETQGRRMKRNRGKNNEEKKRRKEEEKRKK